jgi:hypothetical protein
MRRLSSFIIDCLKRKKRRIHLQLCVVIEKKVRPRILPVRLVLQQRCERRLVTAPLRQKEFNPLGTRDLSTHTCACARARTHTCAHVGVHIGADSKQVSTNVCTTVRKYAQWSEKQMRVR